MDCLVEELAIRLGLNASMEANIPVEDQLSVLIIDAYVCMQDVEHISAQSYNIKCMFILVWLAVCSYVCKCMLEFSLGLCTYV
ncbi:hypothetical protein BGX38DRAFT_1155641 [Terfezia claveryi]|nr:hypothetical protein BGX38DRAFT_1155641 [Terfezia claveryi]